MKKYLFAVAFGATLLGAPALAQDAPQHGAGLLGRLDTNGDGVITREEFDADLAARFARLDTNKDGKVSQAEREAGRAGMGGRMGGRGMRGMTGDMTLADMQAQAGRRFDRLDVNHDGKIDQAEADAMRARMRDRQDRQAPPAADTSN